MKVQIIYLDPHDDQISARDKLKWAQTPHVAMVWAKGDESISTQLDLALLRHHAQRLGRQLTLVTQDPTVRRSAQRVGIPVADSLSDLPEDEWPLPSTAFPPLPPGRAEIWRGAYVPPHERRASALEGRWAHIFRRIAIGFISLTVLATIVSLAPSASIVLQPATHPALMTVRFHLEPVGCPAGDLGCIPAESVELRLQQDLRAPTTGLVRVPETVAHGEAVFSNLTGSPLEIPAGTGVRPNGSQSLRFLTIAPLELDGEIGATGSVEIVATEPGSQGNLPSGSINAIEGSLGLRASVTNPAPLTGGREAVEYGVSAVDVDDLRQDLRIALLEQAHSTITASLTPSQRLAGDSLRISEVLDQEFSPAVGNPSASLAGMLDARLTALIYDQGEFLEAAYQYVDDRMMDEGLRIVPGSMGLVQTGPINLQPDGSAVLHTHARFRSYQRPRIPLLVSTIRGKAPEEARSILERDYGLTVQAIDLSPEWFPWLPWIPSRIQLSDTWTAR